MVSVSRLAEVERRVGLKRTKIYALIASGEFPKPIPVLPKGVGRAWVDSEIDRWLEERIAERDRGEVVVATPPRPKSKGTK